MHEAIIVQFITPVTLSQQPAELLAEFQLDLGSGIRGTEYRILVPRVYRIPSVHARMHAPRRAHAPRRNPEFRISDVSNIAPLLRVFRRFVGTAHQGTKYLPRAPKVSPRPTETDNQTRTAAGERERLTSIEMRPIYGSS